MVIELDVWRIRAKQDPQSLRLLIDTSNVFFATHSSASPDGFATVVIIKNGHSQWDTLYSKVPLAVIANACDARVVESR